jgi:4-amino-4-deoxy-L-arabinose transferase-like glycosyltransferase
MDGMSDDPLTIDSQVAVDPGANDADSHRGLARPKPGGNRLWMWLILIGFCLALYGPGLSRLPVTDRDEARFAQASKQMIETGDYIRIRFQDKPRNKKPAGIHWMHVAAVKSAIWMTGDTDFKNAIWLYRVPSALGATLAVLMLFGVGRHWVGDRRAFFASMILACSPLLVIEAHIAKTDAMLMACAVIAQCMLGSIYTGRRSRDTAIPSEPERSGGRAFVFWIAQGTAFLIKGPIVLMVSLLTVIMLMILDRRNGRGIRWWCARLHVWWGIPVMVVVAAPWYIAISLQGGGSGGEESFGREAFLEDFWSKLTSGQESHGAPPGYHLVLLPILLWSGSLRLAVGLGRAWRERSATVNRFLLAWVLPSWVVFELVPTKLPHYVLPLYPALALFAAMMMPEFGRLRFLKAEPEETMTWSSRIGVSIWAFLGALLAAAGVAAQVAVGHPIGPVEIACAAVSFLLLGVATAFAWQGMFTSAVMTGWAMLAVALVSAMTWTLPACQPIWLSRQIAGVIESEYGQLPDVLSTNQDETTATDQARPIIAAIGFDEPSLVFYLGTDIRFVSRKANVNDVFDPDRDTILIIADDREIPLLDSAAKAGITMESIGTIRGFNYSNGDWKNVDIRRTIRPGRVSESTDDR